MNLPRLFRRIGAGVLALEGVLHAIQYVLARRRLGPEMSGMAFTLKNVRFNAFGLQRSMWDLFGGYSLLLTVLALLLAALTLLLDREELPAAATRRLAGLQFAAVAALLALALAAMPAQLPFAAAACFFYLVGWLRRE